MGEQSNLEIKREEGVVLTKINPKIYNLSVIYTTCYVFVDKAYIHIDGDPEKEISIELKPKKDSNLDELRREFENELIKNAFYNKQHKESLGVKTLLLKRILAMPDKIAELYVHEKIKDKIDEELELIEQELENEDLDDDLFDDPEGIAIPWEEKYGKEQNEPKQGKSEENSGKKV